MNWNAPVRPCVFTKTDQWDVLEWTQITCFVEYHIRKRCHSVAMKKQENYRNIVTIQIFSLNVADICMPDDFYRICNLTISYIDLIFNELRTILYIMNYTSNRRLQLEGYKICRSTCTISPVCLPSGRARKCSGIIIHQFILLNSCLSCDVDCVLANQLHLPVFNSQWNEWRSLTVELSVMS